jgi:hypothetical protein
MIEAGIIEYLLDQSAFAAIVGSRLYPGTIPAPVVYPCARLERVTSFHYEHLAGSSGLVRVSFRLEVFAETYLAAHELAEVVRGCLQGASGEWAGVTVQGVSFGGIGDLSGLEDGIFHLTIGFDVFHI